MKETEKLKSTLSSIFKRKGANGRFTRLFDDLEPMQKEALIKNISFDSEELPIIGSMENQNAWLIITTQRLVWRSGDKTHNLDLKDVWHAKIDTAKMMAANVKKHEQRKLQIETTAHDECIIEVEEGPPLSGVWNVLLNLGARNRRNG